MPSLRHKKIFVAGHNGLVGAALVRRLAREDAVILTVPRAQLDLRRQDDVRHWFAANRPDGVVLAAARVGGIGANMNAPAAFIADNLQIQNNVILAAHEYGVEKLLFLGSSCIYPRNAPQPIAESALLTGPLEPTNDAYAVAKIAGLTLCRALRQQYGRDFITVMPCNLYGPGDRYDAEGSHVIPALILKCHAARQSGQSAITLWGTGTPLREFMYSDDLADALVHALRHYSAPEPLNIGSGQEISIAALAEKVATAVGYQGAINFDPAQPDGVPRKLLDAGRLHALGWRGPLTPLATGLARSYDDYCRRYAAEGQRNDRAGSFAR